MYVLVNVTLDSVFKHVNVPAVWTHCTCLWVLRHWLPNPRWGCELYLVCESLLLLSLFVLFIQNICVHVTHCLAWLKCPILTYFTCACGSGVRPPKRSKAY